MQAPVDICSPSQAKNAAPPICMNIHMIEYLISLILMKHTTSSEAESKAYVASRFESVGVATVLCHKAHCPAAELCQVAAVDGVHIISVGVQLHSTWAPCVTLCICLLLSRKP